MRYKILCICLLFIVSINAQKITLEDICQKYSFYPKGIKQMQSVGNGYYTTVAKGAILLKKYGDYKYEKVLLDSLKVDGKQSYIGSYQLSKNRDKLLIATNIEHIYRHSYRADYYLVNLTTGSTISLTSDKVQQATFSPNAEKVAYVKNNDLYILNLQSNQLVRVTDDGKFREIINGLPDWVYEEEFSFSRAYEWSPDSKQIAYMKFDESTVSSYTLYSYNNNKPYPSSYTYKYPKAGENNSTVSVWVYSTDSKSKHEIDIKPNKEQYIPRIFWTKRPNELLVLRLNRHQNKMEYLIADTEGETIKNVFTETNKYYIDAENFDAITFLNKNEFSILSEIKGYNSLYKFNYRKKKLKVWFERPFDITSFYGVDANGIAYFQVVGEKPYNRTIASVTKRGKYRNLTPRKGYHHAVFDNDFKFMIDKYSTALQPTTYTVKNLHSSKEIVLEDNQSLKEKLKKYNLPKKEFIELPSAKSDIMLSAWRILPDGFDKNNKYPVLITQYSGPNSQSVKNNFSVGWNEYLAQNGFIVYCVDPRGTGARGENFRKVTYMQLGKLESDDMIAVGKHLQTLPYVNANDLTIWGWSYGGFMSALCLMKGEGVFANAISVAPVTHWKFYDTVYTERFMRTPKENPDGYNLNSPLENVKKLKGRKYNWLLVHGTKDDNVHIQNTYVLTDKLVRYNIPFKMHVYSDKNHSIVGGKTRLHLYKRFMEFLNTRN